MRKLVLVLLVLALAGASALGLAACGGSSGKEGGTLTGSSLPSLPTMPRLSTKLPTLPLP